MKTVRNLFLLSFALFLSACNLSLAGDVTPPPNYQPPVESPQPAPVSGPLYPLVPPSAADGEAVYAEKCAPCHGESGLGDGERAAQLPNPVTALGNPEVARAANPASWYEVVTRGNLDRFMPPFSSLTDGQRWDVVAYAFSLSAPADQLAQGDRLYEANCAACHGPEGKGDGPQAAGLTRPVGDFTNLEVMAGKSAADFFTVISEGTDQGMPAFKDQLSEDERWLLGEFVRSRMFAPVEQNIAGVAAAGTPEQATAGTPDGSTELPGTTVPGTPVAEGDTLPAATAALTLGSISGQVSNASGGEIPAGLEITLHGFDHMNAVITDTTTIQPDGRFEFDNVEMTEGRFFLTTTEYQGATYGSEIAPIEAGVNSMDLPINVYETTTDASALSIDRLHLFFEFTDEQTLRVIQLLIISNTGDKTVVAPETGKPVITFALPVGASNLQFQDGSLGERYVETEKGFGDTQPVRPGESSYQVLYAFDMPYNRKLDLVQPMNLPANAVVVLVPQNSIQVKGDNLENAGTRDVEGTPYQMYNIPSLKSGDELRLTITGGPTSASPTLASGSSTELLVGLAAFGLVLIFTGVWLYRRSQATADSDELELPEEEPAPESQETSESLMDAILALDDLYKAGKLPEDAYQQRRAELKERLRVVMKNEP